jgi:hypothetical protein
MASFVQNALNTLLKCGFKEKLEPPQPSDHEPFNIGPPATTRSRGGHYLHHEPHNKVNMAAAADFFGPTYVGNHASLWGYPGKVSESTIRTWQRQSPSALADPHRRHAPPTHATIKQEVADTIQAMARVGEQTTSDLVEDLFQARGLTLSRPSLSRFREKAGFTLLAQDPIKPRSFSDDLIEKSVREVWKLSEQLRSPDTGRDLDDFIWFDEKPLWVERHKRKVWKTKRRVFGSPAEQQHQRGFVKDEGRTRQRETVILPASFTGRKFPILFNFHGLKQLKVPVHKDYPALVLFTPTAMANTEVLKYQFDRAIAPNLARPEKAVLWLDSAPCHETEEFQTHITPCNTAVIPAPLTRL